MAKFKSAAAAIVSFRAWMWGLHPVPANAISATKSSALRHLGALRV